MTISIVKKTEQLPTEEISCRGFSVVLARRRYLIFVILYLCGGKVQPAKRTFSGKGDTWQLREERGTESVRRNTNEKEEDEGRRKLWRYKQRDVGNT